MVKLVCPDCGKTMVRRVGPYGDFYGCSGYPNCKATHCVHQATGKPLGIPANKDTRQARMAAHTSLDVFWKEHGYHRRTVYRWLAEKMCIKENECHIGLFSLDQCVLVIELCQEMEKKLSQPVQK